MIVPRAMHQPVCLPLLQGGPYLGNWGQSKLERQVWGAAVQLELLLLRLALVRVDGAAVLRHQRVHGCD